MKTNQTSKARYYLAYGSNLNLEQMRGRCPHAKKVGTAVINDYRLVFKGVDGNCHLTIVPILLEEVPVGVFAVNEEDEASLDDYEGYPSYYYKQDFEVTLENGTKINGFAYIMVDRKEWQTGFPSNRYYGIVKQGYKNFGFDQKLITEALERSVARFGNLGWVTKVVDGRLMGFPMTAEQALRLRGRHLCTAGEEEI